MGVNVIIGVLDILGRVVQCVDGRAFSGVFDYKVSAISAVPLDVFACNVVLLFPSGLLKEKVPDDESDNSTRSCYETRKEVWVFDEELPVPKGLWKVLGRVREISS